MAPANRLIVVANRLPVRRVKRAGKNAWETSPGGLVAAMEPMLNRGGGSWVGWTGVPGKVPPAFDHENMRIRPVPINADQLESFYEGFSNTTLWPLYHDAVRTPQFHRRWWWPYTDVNRQFAQATADEARDGDLVWVHDYQLQLVPGMLRELRPGVRIGYFLHIPFPPEELFAQLPWRRQILEGLLGADVVGFQTKAGARNFAAAARQFTEATGTDRNLKFRGRTVRVDAFPISIDVSRMSELASSPTVRDLSDTLCTDLASTRSGVRKVMMGIDRLDYTKGIDIRLRAYQELLRRGTFTVEDCVMVQIAVPSREGVDDYAALRERVEQHVGRINGEYGKPGRDAVYYMRRNLPPEELVAYYRAADVMLVTPLRDGMNLVAKEYVVAHDDEPGALVLSEFAGAAEELKGGALLVNPHDVDGLATTMETALSMSPTEMNRRMATMRRAVSKNDVFGWAQEFLDTLAETRAPSKRKSTS